MTGPEHYAEAERLIKKPPTDGPVLRGITSHEVALAQVHATLALAAATATPLQLAEPAGTVPGGEAQHWFEVL